MIQYYQELLNECIDIQEHNKILNILNKMKKLMKGDKDEQTSSKKKI